MRTSLLTAALLASLLAASAPADPRPNFLIIISDDQSAIDNGCYGNGVIRTPHIDRLASQGMRFTAAFTATAMCSPSRSVMYTGLYPVRNGAYPNHSQIHPHVRTLPQFLSELGYHVALANKVHVGPRDQFPFQYIPMKQVASFLSDSAHRPFCLIVATNDPHAPYAANTTYDPAALPLPPYLLDTPETRSILADYYTDVTNMDSQVGQTLDALRDAALEQNTLVIYTSDHGAGLPFAKWTCYDAGLNVPFIVRWPGRVQPGSVSNALIHYVDVLPTLIQLAGGKAPEDLDGRSFADLLTAQRTEHHDAVFGVHTTRGINAGSDAYPIRSIRTARYKYILNLNHEAAFHNVITRDRAEHANAFWRSWVAAAETDPHAAHLVNRYLHRPAHELYDLLHDPHELTNLADDPAHQTIRRDLDRRLRQWMLDQGDLGLDTEMDALNRQGRTKQPDKAGRKNSRS